MDSDTLKKVIQQQLELRGTNTGISSEDGLAMSALKNLILKPLGTIATGVVAPFSDKVSLSDIGDIWNEKPGAIYSFRDAFKQAGLPEVVVDIPKYLTPDKDTRDSLKKALSDIPLLGDMSVIDSNELSDFAIPFIPGKLSPLKQAGSLIKKGLSAVEQAASKGGRVTGTATKLATKPTALLTEIQLGSVAKPKTESVIRKAVELSDEAKSELNIKASEIYDDRVKSLLEAFEQNPELASNPEALEQMKLIELTNWQKKGLAPQWGTVQHIGNIRNIDTQSFLMDMTHSIYNMAQEKAVDLTKYNRAMNSISKEYKLAPERVSDLLEGIGESGKILDNEAGKLVKTQPEGLKEQLINIRKQSDHKAYFVMNELKKDLDNTLDEYLKIADTIPEKDKAKLLANRAKVEENIFKETQEAFTAGNEIGYSPTLRKTIGNLSKEGYYYKQLTEDITNKEVLRDISSVLHRVDPFDYVEGYVPRAYEKDILDILNTNPTKTYGRDTVADWLDRSFMSKLMKRETKEPLNYEKGMLIRDYNRLNTLYTEEYLRYKHLKPLANKYRDLQKQLDIPLLNVDEQQQAILKLTQSIENLRGSAVEGLANEGEALIGRTLFDKMLNSIGDITPKEAVVFKHFYGLNQDLFQNMARTLTKKNVNWSNINKLIGEIADFDIDKKKITALRSEGGKLPNKVKKDVLDAFDVRANTLYELKKESKELTKELKDLTRLSRRESGYQIKRKRIDLKERLGIIDKEMEVAKSELAEVLKTEKDFMKSALTKTSKLNISPTEKYIIQGILANDSKFIPKELQGVLEALKTSKGSLKETLKGTSNVLKGAIGKMEYVPSKLKATLKYLQDEKDAITKVIGKSSSKVGKAELIANSAGKLERIAVQPSAMVDNIVLTSSEALNQLTSKLSEIGQELVHTPQYNKRLELLDTSIKRLQSKLASGSIKTKAQFNEEFKGLMKQIDKFVVKLKREEQTYEAIFGRGQPSSVFGTNELAARAEKFMKENIPTLKSDSQDFFSDFFAHSMGMSDLEGYTAQETIKSRLESISAGTSKGFLSQFVPKDVAKYLSTKINPELKGSQITDKVIAEMYKNMMGFKITPIVRNLGEVMFKTLPSIQGINPVTKLKLMTESVYEVLSNPQVIKRIKSIGIRAPELTSESTYQASKMFKPNSGVLSTAAEAWGKLNRAGMYLWSASDAFDRYVTFRFGEKAAEHVLKKGSSKDLAKLFNKALFNEQEVNYLMNFVKGGRFEEAATNFGDILQQKSHLVYQNSTDAPFMKNKINKVLFMFAKYPLDIYRREARFANKLLSKGTDRATRVAAARGIGQDMFYGLAMIAFGRAIGLNIDDYHPLSNLTLKYKPPVLAMLTDPSLKRLGQVALPIDAMTKGVQRLAGQGKYGKNYVPVLSIQKHEGGVFANPAENKAIGDSILADILKLQRKVTN